MTTTLPAPPLARRGATTALVGGVLWTLLPVAARFADVEEAEHGTLAFVATVAAYWIFLVLPPALLVVGLRELWSALGGTAGRVGRTGIVLSGAGLAAMTVGNGIQMVSVTVGGDGVEWAHDTFLIGFLVTVAGGILLGSVAVRRSADPLARTAGALLVLAFPLGLGLGLLGTTIDPHQDAWFWAAITVPTGIAWVLLGRWLARTPRSTAAPEVATTS
jgi:hypothetical protein